MNLAFVEPDRVAQEWDILSTDFPDTLDPFIGYFEPTWIVLNRNGQCRGYICSTHPYGTKGKELQTCSSRVMTMLKDGIIPSSRPYEPNYLVFHISCEKRNWPITPQNCETALWRRRSRTKKYLARERRLAVTVQRYNTVALTTYLDLCNGSS